MQSALQSDSGGRPAGAVQFRWLRVSGRSLSNLASVSRRDHIWAFDEPRPAVRPESRPTERSALTVSMPGMRGLDLARDYSGPTACRHGHHVVADVGKDRRESCLVVCGNRPNCGYSGEADHYSGLIAIMIPGSCRSPSERSDAGLFHDRSVIGISQTFSSERGVGCGARGRRLSPFAPPSNAAATRRQQRHGLSFFAAPRFLRIDSPFSSRRCAL